MPPFMGSLHGLTSRISNHGSHGWTRMTESETDWLKGLIRAGREIRGSMLFG
jgi:hypothetical protein